MTRAREPPADPVVDSMERVASVGKKLIQLSPPLPFVSELIHHGWSSRCVRPWLSGLLVRSWRLTELVDFLGPGFNPHLPGFRHQFLAKALGATMWFFIFYRARCVTPEYTLIIPDNPPAVHRQDGAKLLVRPVTFTCPPIGSPLFRRA